jgi:diacylglycerol kinase family enzyme
VVTEHFTAAPGHGTTLAEAAVAAGAHAVVAVGGDGTVNEVVQGFLRCRSEAGAAPSTRLAVLPAGTGNDLCLHFGW